VDVFDDERAELGEALCRCAQRDPEVAAQQRAEPPLARVDVEIFESLGSEDNEQRRQVLEREVRVPGLIGAASRGDDDELFDAGGVSLCPGEDARGADAWSGARRSFISNEARASSASKSSVIFPSSSFALAIASLLQ